jgi:hypothetical protein
MSKNRKFSNSSVGGEDRRQEVMGVIGLGAGLFLLIAMVSLQAGALARFAASGGGASLTGAAVGM